MTNRFVKRRLCDRTTALWQPGVKINGVYCRFAYSGRVPGTGEQRCAVCGKQPNDP